MQAIKLVEHCGSKREAARQMGVSRPTIYAWLRDGLVPIDWVARAEEVVATPMPVPAPYAGSNVRWKRILKAREGVGGHTPEEWEKILEKYGHKCLRCGSTQNICKDHVVPIAIGGSDKANNLQPLCSKCNVEKYARTMDFRPKFP